MFDNLFVLAGPFVTCVMLLGGLVTTTAWFSASRRCAWLGGDPRKALGGP